MPNTRRSEAELAYIDDLTGLYNRRYLNLNLPKELAKAKERKNPISLFMIDFDNFKDINDTYGHLNGDKVLVEISAVIKNAIGEEGIFIRYAGDEFTILLLGKALKDALLLGDKLLRTISAHKLELKSGKRLANFSFSMGVAVYPDDAGTAENLIDKADQALYSAKRMGKNRIAAVGDIVIEARDREAVLNALPCKRLIGRNKEMDALKSICESVGKGGRRYILISGRDGIGKTRLMFEVFNPAKISPKPFVLRCSREDAYQEFGAITSALDDFQGSFEVKERTGLEEKIFSTITSIATKLKSDKIIFLIDDILWIDKGSLKIIERALKYPAFNNVNVLVIATLPKKDYKVAHMPFSEFIPSGKEMPQSETIELGPLSESGVSELLKTVFSGLLIPPQLEKRIYEETGGVPAAIEEIIKYMLNKKVVYPTAGKWVLDEKSLDVIPSSMSELLNKLISELDDDAKEVLRKAAVLGNEVNIDILKSLYGRNEGQLLDTLDKLKKEGILGQDLLGKSGVLSFVNSIIRDSIYNSIRKSELQETHKRIARLIQDYYKSEINKVYGGVRYHLEEAGEEAGMPFGIGEAMPSAEELAEKPLSEKSAKIAPNIVMLLRAAWLNSQLYPLDNKTCVDSIENLYSEITAILENDPTLTVTASGDGIVLNGELISRKKINVMLSHALSSLFLDSGISSITFKRGLPEKELESFFDILTNKEDTEKPDEIAKLLKDSEVTKIKIDGVKYRKISDFRISERIKDSALAKVILENPVLKEIFLMGKDGMEISEKTVNSISNSIRDISKQAIDDKDKILLMLEGLNMATAELSVKDKDGWEKEKKGLADIFLSMEPSLRTRIIGDSTAYESGGSNFVCDILSGFGEDSMVKILKEGYGDSKLSPEKLKNFLIVALKSQQRVTYDEIRNLFRKAGIDEETIAKALENAPLESFFEDLAKEFIKAGKSDVLKSKVINNLRPLTEALAIKGDTKTIQDLVNNLIEKLNFDSAAVRSSAAEGLDRISNVLLEKEIFYIASTVGSALQRRLKIEENLKVYIELLKDFEDVVSILIQKHKLSLLIAPLSALEEEAAPSSQRSNEFKRYAKAAISRALSVESMNTLLLLLRTKSEKDYAVITDLVSHFKSELMPSLMGVLSKKDDMKWDPFEIYLKKQNVAAVLKKMGEEAIIEIADLANDKRPMVAQNVVEVFSYINDIKYLPYLEKAAIHSDKEVRKAALEAVRKLSDGDTVAKFLIKILPHEKEPDLISKLIDAICELASQQLTPYIKNELKGKIKLEDYDELVTKLANKK